MNSLFVDVLLYVGIGFFGMLLIVFPLFCLTIWAAEKWLTKQYKKEGRL